MMIRINQTVILLANTVRSVVLFGVDRLLSCILIYSQMNLVVLEALLGCT